MMSGRVRLPSWVGAKRRRQIQGPDDDEERYAVSARNVFGESGDDEDEEEADEVQEQFVTKKPKTRRMEEETLGVAGCRSTCFGCVYVGERTGAAIPHGDLRKLIEMSRQSIGRTDLIVLCKAMAEFYERFRRKVNRHLLAGERRLPRWPAAMILDHIRYHNQDPEIQQVVLLAEIQELRGAVFNACLEESTVTGQVRGNKEQVGIYERLSKLQLHVQSKKAADMAFYSAGARLDPRVSNQGLISTNTKPLIDYWQETAIEYQ